MTFRGLYSLNVPGSFLCILLCACGSGVVDVGDQPDDGSAGADGSGDGFLPDPTTPPCNLPGLDQHRLLFDSDAGGLERRIYSMRADGTGLEALTPPGELAREPAMSPDGNTLAYATPEGVKLLDMRTGQSELLVPGVSQPAWSPDGTMLTYRSGNPTTYSANLLLRDLSGEREDLGWGCNACDSPSFTRDGAGLVYAETLIGGGDALLPRVAALEWASGAGREVIAGGGLAVMHPTLSPDGVWMAASLECAGSTQPSLWISPFATNTPACEGRRTTAADAPSARNPEWGPGVFITYELGEPPRDLAIVAADTGETCSIAGPGDDRNPTWATFPVDPPQ